MPNLWGAGHLHGAAAACWHDARPGVHSEVFRLVRDRVVCIASATVLQDHILDLFVLVGGNKMREGKTKKKKLFYSLFYSLFFIFFIYYFCSGAPLADGSVEQATGTRGDLGRRVAGGAGERDW